jgi:hypothetical protein
MPSPPYASDKGKKKKRRKVRIDIGEEEKLVFIASANHRCPFFSDLNFFR